MPTHTFVTVLRKYGNKNQCVNGVLGENYPIKIFLQFFYWDKICINIQFIVLMCTIQCFLITFSIFCNYDYFL